MSVSKFFSLTDGFGIKVVSILAEMVSRSLTFPR